MKRAKIDMKEDELEILEGKQFHSAIVFGKEVCLYVSNRLGKVVKDRAMVSG